MKQLHKIQRQIIAKFMFEQEVRYSDLKPNQEMENNHLQHHLNQLIKATLVEKVGDKYQLTTKGKKLSTKIDHDTSKIIKQAHVSVRVACRRKHKGKTQYLFYTRLKHPYYGCQGFPSGKLELGEKILDGAMRELNEETGLEPGKKGIDLALVTHFIDYDTDGFSVLTDKLMFVCLIEDPVGKLVQSKEGRYEWINVEDIAEWMEKPFENIETVLEEITLLESFDGNVDFTEREIMNADNF